MRMSISRRPSDAKKLADAKVVVANGLGFEGWIARLIKASGTKAPMIVATKGVKPRKADDDGHGHGDADPHAWQSVANAKIYVANIRDALIAADPAGKSAYEANAAAYLAKLDALDAEVKAAIAKIPADRRKIITTHDAFGYFAAAYGVTFIAPQGVSTEVGGLGQGRRAGSSRRSGSRKFRRCSWKTSPTTACSSASAPRAARASAARSIPTR